jgi:hypothetical protein
VAAYDMVVTSQDPNALDRIYYYNASIVYNPGEFDSSLRASNMSSYYGLRPAFCVLSAIDPVNCQNNIWAKGTGNNP